MATVAAGWESLACSQTTLAGPQPLGAGGELEFTADASNELRTPLSIISAEADAALTGPRAAAEIPGRTGTDSGR